VAAFGDTHLFVGPDQIGDALPGAAVDDDRSLWYPQHEVHARLAALVLRAAVGSARCGERFPEAEVRQRGHPGVDAECDASAPASVTAIRPAARNMRLASERDDPGAAVAAFDHDARAIQEHA